MRPYYDDGTCTIYHGDCQDVLGLMEASSVDLALADPPYNVGKGYASHDDHIPVEIYIPWLRGIYSQCWVLSPALVFFPGTRYLLDSRAFVDDAGYRPIRTLGWHRKEYAGDKFNGGPAMSWEPIIWASRAEPPYCNTVFGPWGRDFLIVDSVRRDPYRQLHPCPKPIEVMRWLIGLFCPPGGMVVDPFLGSGTTLRAAKDLGRRAIGIEIEERYCEIAARRLGQEVLAL